MSSSTVILMVMLDALFDTRIGTVAQIDLKKSAELLKDENYADRLWDLFPGVDPKVYSEVYAKRNRATLKLSQTTGVISILRNFVKMCAETALKNPKSLTPEIHVNFYPYDLTESEQKLILAGVQQVIPLQPEVKAVNYSLEDLNPYFCKSKYHTMVMYHGSEWLEIHTANGLLQKCPIPNVTLFTPVILNKKPDNQPPPENIREQFYTLSITSQFLINLMFVNLDTFCSWMSKPRPGVKSQEESPVQQEEGSLQEQMSSDPTGHQNQPEIDLEALRSEQAHDPRPGEEMRRHQ